MIIPVSNSPSKNSASPVLVGTPGFPLSWPPVFGFLSYVLASPRRKKWQVTRRSYSVSVPIGSMYAIYGNIYHQYTPVMLAYIYHTWILWGMTAGEPSWMTSSSSYMSLLSSFNCSRPCRTKLSRIAYASAGDWVVSEVIGGTPKSSKSFDHFSLKPILGIPHFKETSVYIYIYNIYFNTSSTSPVQMIHSTYQLLICWLFTSLCWCPGRPWAPTIDAYMVGLAGLVLSTPTPRKQKKNRSLSGWSPAETLTFSWLLVIWGCVKTLYPWWTPK